MNEFWLWVIALIAAVVIIFGVPFNCIKSAGPNKKVVLIGNGILAGVLVSTLLLMLTDNLIRSPYKSDYTSEGGGLFNTVEYLGSFDKHHVFSYYRMFDGADIAVPEQLCDIPPLANVYPKVILYYDSGRPLYTKNKTGTFGEYDCFVSTSVEAVFTDFSDIILVILIFDVPLLFLFNLTEIFIVFKGTSKNRFEKRK